MECEQNAESVKRVAEVVNHKLKEKVFLLLPLTRLASPSELEVSRENSIKRKTFITMFFNFALECVEGDKKITLCVVVRKFFSSWRRRKKKFFLVECCLP